MDTYVVGTGHSDDIFNDSYVDTNNKISIHKSCGQSQSLSSQESQSNQTLNNNFTESTDDWTAMIDNASSVTSNSWTNIMDKKQLNCDRLVQSQNIFVCKSDDKEKKEDRQQKTVEHLDIEDTRSIHIKSVNDLNLLEKSSMIAKNLKFQFNKRYDDDKHKFAKWMVQSLEWLRDVMYELSARTFQLKKEEDQSNTLSPVISPSLNSRELNQEDNSTNNNANIDHDSSQCLNTGNGSLNKKTQNISRNSYKFCEFGHECKFNYDKDQKCYAQHFVYNLVYLDIVDILEYITSVDILCSLAAQGTSVRTQDMSEIKTSINTITYVINHMSEELTQLKVMRPECYEDYENRVYKFRSVNGFKQRTKKNKNFSSVQEDTKFGKSGKKTVFKLSSNQDLGFFNRDRQIQRR